MLAVILICGTMTMLTSCSVSDNPVDNTQATRTRLTAYHVPMLRTWPTSLRARASRLTERKPMTDSLTVKSPFVISHSKTVCCLQHLALMRLERLCLPKSFWMLLATISVWMTGGTSPQPRISKVSKNVVWTLPSMSKLKNTTSGRAVRLAFLFALDTTFLTGVKQNGVHFRHLS